MAKGKSSASSGTRKKNARKAAAKDGVDPSDAAEDLVQPVQRGQKKSKVDKKAPKIKQYIPPPPPPKGIPDPVDRLGLGTGSSTVTPERIVLLRKVAKRDAVTVERGLEEWEEWARKASTGGQEEQGELLETIPVWAHHYPRLVGHPSRRVRALAVGLHSILLGICSCRELLLAPMELEREEYVGGWLLSAWDSDRGVRAVSTKSWDDCVEVGEAAAAPEGEKIILTQYTPELLHHLSRLILPAESEQEPAHAPNTSKPTIVGRPATDDAPRKVNSLDEPPALTRARMRTAALDALSYLLRTHPDPLEQKEPSFADILGNENTWMLLDKSTKEEPSVRRAVWGLIGTLAGEQRLQSILEPHLAIVSKHALHSAFDELDQGTQTAMITGVVPLLRAFPDAWVLADAQTPPIDDASNSSGDDSEEEPEDKAETLIAACDATTTPPILRAFFSYLTMGCSQNPIMLYPTTLLLLSTLPKTIFSPTGHCESFFVSFWAAADGRVLDSAGPKAYGAFTESWAECLVWCLGRLENEVETASAQALASSEVKRMWDAFLGSAPKEIGGRKGRFEVAGATLLQLLGRLSDQVEVPAWIPIEASVRREQEESSPVVPRLVLIADWVVELSTKRENRVSPKAEVLKKELLLWSIGGLTEKSDSMVVPVLNSLLQSEVVDSEVEGRLVQLSSGRLPTLVLENGSTSTLDLLFLLLRRGGGVGASAWKSVVSVNALTTQPRHIRLLESLIGFVENEGPGLTLASANLDKLVTELAKGAITASAPNSEQISVLSKLLRQPSPFVDVETVEKILATLAARLDLLSRACLYDVNPDFESCASPLQVASSYIAKEGATEAILAKESTRIIPLAAFEMACLAPLRVEAASIGIVSTAEHTAAAFAKISEEESKHQLLLLGLGRLKACVLDTNCLSNPIDLAAAARKLVQYLAPSKGNGILFQSFLPSESEMDVYRIGASARTTDPTISITDPLVPPGDDEDGTVPPNAPTHAELLYDRIGLALLDVILHDRVLSRSHLWVLEHTLFIGQLARDRLALERCGGVATPSELEAIAAVAETTCTYLLSSLAQTLTKEWQATAVSRVRKNESSPGDPLTSLIGNLASATNTDAGVSAARSLRKALGSILRYSDSGSAEAERWLALAQSLQEKSPRLAVALVWAVKEQLLDSPRFERYQNELASTLAGVESTAANGKGLELLTLLCATAPPADSPCIFLPQQRAIFLLQNLQRWISSDEDLDDAVHTKVVEIFVHLAPVVQSMSGAHWDLMFDVIESNVENASWTEPKTMLALWHSCQLLKVLRDLTVSNSNLREIVKPQFAKALPLIQSFFTARPVSNLRDAPADLVANLIVGLLSDLPTSTGSLGDSFSALVALLTSPSLQARATALRMTTAIVHKYVEDLVVEAELDADAEKIYELPDVLLQLVSTTNQITSLLAWLLVFAFYDSSSVRLRNQYNAQLRDANLVASSLLPLVFGILDVSDRGRPFDPSPWAIDDFDVSHLDDESPNSLSLLAAFVYFRALQSVSSHIRSWWHEARNKQLSMSVQSFTSRHFSPLLLNRELDRIRDPRGMATLKDDNLTIKVSPALREVKAIYVVDEQNMEIAIRMPSDYPLQSIEVIDIKKVGVPEAQWRAWLLAVKQTVTTQNGSMVEALGLFKRNISLHFEGVEACAICYSVISVTDRSLPTKECRTCHNKFHPSCLFKWFSTSHGSSCPLCRSLF